MKNLSAIIVLILVTAALKAPGQDAVDSLSVNKRVDTLIGTSVDSLIDTPINTSVNTPIDTLIDTSVNTSINTPIDTSINTSINTPIDTSINTSINTIDSSTNPSTNTSTDTSIKTPVKTSKKIFLLPSYTFHIVFLAVSVALIVATVYYFLTRRRDDSRRFLTTTRLSVLDKLVQRGCRHIESNYPDPALTPEAVCNSLVTGKAYLDALFMNELGINVQDFIVQVRVNAIKNRLSEAAQSQQPPDVEEICAECGFADRAEAERSFAAVCGGVGIAEFARFSKLQSQRR